MGGGGRVAAHGISIHHPNMGYPNPSYPARVPLTFEYTYPLGRLPLLSAGHGRLGLGPASICHVSSWICVAVVG